MAEQWQVRRGSAALNNDFTGAVGEVTMDITNKTLRVHDGTTIGGIPLAKQAALDSADYVIEWQLPTAENNYSWYRKYKSGWIEQGGIIAAEAASTTGTVVLPTPFTTTSYKVDLIYEHDSSLANGYWLRYKNLTTTSFDYAADTWNNYYKPTVQKRWMAVGL